VSAGRFRPCRDWLPGHETYWRSSPGAETTMAPLIVLIVVTALQVLFIALL
jgi:hypothetical protein